MMHINSYCLSKEISDKTSGEKPRNLWNHYVDDKYQVKAIHNNYANIKIFINLYNFFNHLFYKRTTSQFLLLIQQMNQKRQMKK